MHKHYLICGFFLLIYALFGLMNFGLFGSPNNSNDFYFHFQKSAGILEGDTAEYYSQEFYDNYAPLSSVYGGWFGLNIYLFYLGVCLLVLFFIPTFLFWASENNVWVTILYFCSVGLPHQLIFNSTFAQAMLLLLLACYLFFRGSKYRVYAWFGLAFLSIFTHKQGGLPLFIGIAFLEIVIYFAKKWDLRRSAFVVLGGVTLNASHLFNLFFEQSNIWVSYLAIKNAFSSKELFYFGLMVAGFVFSKIDIRVFALFQIGAIMLASKEIQQFKNKRLLICVLILHLFVLLFEYWGKTLLVLQM